MLGVDLILTANNKDITLKFNRDNLEYLVLDILFTYLTYFLNVNTPVKLTGVLTYFDTKKYFELEEYPNLLYMLIIFISTAESIGYSLSKREKFNFTKLDKLLENLISTSKISEVKVC